METTSITPEAPVDGSPEPLATDPGAAVGADRRRDARTLVGERAAVELGPTSLEAIVRDVSSQGLGLELELDVPAPLGATIWVRVGGDDGYALTGTVRWSGAGRVGVALDEILAGPALELLGRLPVV